MALAPSASNTRAAIYARISEDDDQDELGVRRQVKLCRNLAAALNLEIIETLIDNDVSAYSRKPRPAFERLVEVLEFGDVDSIVVYHADRLYRRNTDLERLVKIVEETGAQVHTVAAGDLDLATASGRMVARMLGAAAQHESERLGERMKAKNDELVSDGQPPARAPYGYAPDAVLVRGRTVRTLKIVEEHAATIRKMADRVLAGIPLDRIADDLNSDGIPPRGDRGQWRGTAVRATLLNPAIAGLRVHRRQIAGPGNWTPILERDEWEEVRTKLTDPSRSTFRPSRGYLLSGLVFSSNGQRMSGHPNHATGRRTYETKSAPWTTVGADELEGIISEALLSTLDDVTLPAPGSPKLTAGISAIESELAELAELRGRGEITLAEWVAARRPMMERLEEAKKAIRPRSSPNVRKLLGKPRAIRRAWERDDLDLDSKREVLELVIERVIVGPAFRGRWTEPADRLLPENGGGIVWRT